VRLPRFTLSHPALAAAIVGTSNPEHLRASVAIAGKGPLPDDLYEEARNRLKPADA
jgi:aryl-alcohol dehydrogenase-like predicted oxidoreductase